MSEGISLYGRDPNIRAGLITYTCDLMSVDMHLQQTTDLETVRYGAALIRTSPTR
jgi:hypothetical protein